MRFVWLIIGALAVVAGVIFTLQGLNILGGSSMSGERMWAIIGPIIAIVGLALLVFSFVGGRRAAAS